MIELFRDAQSTGYNASTRVISARAASTAEVRRYDWLEGREYIEILSHEDGAVDLSRVAAGTVSLLLDHRIGAEHRIGVVQSARMDGQDLRIEALLSPRRDDIATDLAGGIGWPVSIGYQVDEWREIEKRGDVAVIMITRWRLLEVSLVSVPADGSTGVGRGQKNADWSPFRARALAAGAARGTKMNESEAPPAEPAKVVDVAKLRKRERERALAISNIGRTLGAAQKDIDSAIENGERVESFAARVAGSAPSGQVPSQPRIEARDANADQRIGLIERSIRYRIGVEKQRPAEAEGVRTEDLLRACLREQGLSASGDASQLWSRTLLSRQTRAHTPADFPSLLSASMNKAILSAYQEAPVTYRMWARERAPLKDYKQGLAVTVGQYPALVTRLNGNQVEYKSIGDRGETMQLVDRAAGVALTRQVVINDDLDAFATIAAAAPLAAARDENAMVYGVLTANAAMSDAVALFHASHGNLATGTGSALTTANFVTAISTVSALMRVQTDESGVRINAAPRYLIVPAAHAGVALSGTASLDIGSGTALAANPYASERPFGLIPVVEALLDGASTAHWYVAADPRVVPSVAYARLEGESGPVMTEHLDFGSETLQIVVRNTFAAAAANWRGIVRSNNA